MLHLAVVRSLHGRAKLLKVSGGINSSELKARLSSVGEGASETPIPIEITMLHAATPRTSTT